MPAIKQFADGSRRNVSVEGGIMAQYPGPTKKPGGITRSSWRRIIGASPARQLRQACPMIIAASAWPRPRLWPTEISLASRDVRQTARVHVCQLQKKGWHNRKLSAPFANVCQNLRIKNIHPEHPNEMPRNNTMPGVRAYIS